MGLYPDKTVSRTERKAHLPYLIMEELWQKSEQNEPTVVMCCKVI